AIIFGVLIGTHTTGYALSYRWKAKLVSEIVFFVGCLVYGGGIWLVADIFNLHAHYPNGLWLWALGVLPLALCLETPLLHVLLVGLLGAWAGTEVLGFTEIGGWFFGRW